MMIDVVAAWASQSERESLSQLFETGEHVRSPSALRQTATLLYPMTGGSRAHTYKRPPSTLLIDQ